MVKILHGADFHLDSAFSALSAELYAMYDENNEDVSLDAAKIARLDGEFTETFDRERALRQTKAYIEAHFAEISA